MDLSQPEYKRRTVEGIQQKAAVRYHNGTQIKETMRSARF